MEKMIAYCGLVCTECPTYIATKNDDDKKREETAADWSKKYDADIKPTEINCDGCIPDTPKGLYHPNVCEVRLCGQEKGIKNCAYCEEYICERLDEFYKAEPLGKSTLDEIRQGL